MRHFTIAALLAVAALGSACATRSLSQNQCVAGDWQTVGYRDGAQGYDQTRLLTHQEACGKYGVIPDRARYLDGWREGVTRYCIADHGFELGESGRSYSDICPAAERVPFLDAYAQGRAIYRARSEVQQLEATLARSHERLQAIDARVLELSAAQMAPDLGAERRVELFTQVKNLLEEKQHLEHDIPVIERDLAQAQRRLDEVRRVS